MKEAIDMTLHHDPRSPNARVVLVIMRELDIRVKERLVDLKKGEQKNDDFRRRFNPRGLVPVLTIGEESIAESRAIGRYLIDSFAECAERKRLVSVDVHLSYEIDRVLWISAELDHNIMSYLNIPGVLHRGESKQVEWRSYISRMFDTIETNLKKHNEQFVAGPNLTIADLFCAMPIFTLATLTTSDGSNNNDDDEQDLTKDFPILCKWMRKVTARRSWIDANRRGAEELAQAYRTALLSRKAPCASCNQ